METTTLSLAHTNGPEAMNSLKMKIAGDTVNKATADLPDDQRSALRWLHNYGVLKNLGCDELAVLLKKEDGTTYSRDSVYQALTGRRNETSLAPFCRAIERLQKMEETRAGTERAPFIETALTKRIWKICRAALAYQRIAFVYGDSQIGKTTAFIEYARLNNHGETVYVRMPARGAYGEFIKHLAKSLRIRSTLSVWQLKERIFEAIDNRMLLIVDQCHECFRTKNSGSTAAALLFIMEIFDRCNCGIVLSGTGDFERGMMDKAHAEELKQIIRRGFPKPLRLPAKPTNANLADFAAYYGLPPADGQALQLQSEIIALNDLGVWLTTLQSGGRLATRRKQPMTWAHVQDAYAGFLAMAGESEAKAA
jgi:DNA transposition AAA+ family ATPase